MTTWKWIIWKLIYLELRSTVDIKNFLNLLILIKILKSLNSSQLGATYCLSSHFALKQRWPPATACVAGTLRFFYWDSIIEAYQVCLNTEVSHFALRQPYQCSPRKAVWTRSGLKTESFTFCVETALPRLTKAFSTRYVKISNNLCSGGARALFWGIICLSCFTVIKMRRNHGKFVPRNLINLLFKLD